MKKRIRINEGQLKDLVETILKELDARTYAHAAQMAGNDLERNRAIANNKFSAPLTKERAKQLANRRQKQQDAFIDRLNQDVNSNMGLPTDTKIFNKKNINGEDYVNNNTPDKHDNTLRGKYTRDMSDFFRGNSYYDNGVKNKIFDIPNSWKGPEDEDYKFSKSVNFENGSNAKHPQQTQRMSQYESIVHNIAENVIRKLNEGIYDELKEDYGTRNLALLIDNDEECQKQVQWIVQALVKKVRRGLVPELDYLADCSTVRKILQMGMRKLYAQARDYETPMPYLDNGQKRQVRLYIAQCILDAVEYETNNSAE